MNTNYETNEINVTAAQAGTFPNPGTPYVFMPIVHISENSLDPVVNIKYLAIIFMVSPGRQSPTMNHHKSKTPALVPPEPQAVTLTFPEIMEPELAAKYLRLNKGEARTLANWRMRGVGPPFVKMGHKMIRYRKGTLDAWMANREYQFTTLVLADQE